MRLVRVFSLVLIEGFEFAIKGAMIRRLIDDIFGIFLLGVTIAKGDGLGTMI